MIEYVSSAHVIEYVAPAPAVTFDAPSQQFTATVAIDVNLDITSLMSPQFSSAAVEASAPQVVVSLPPILRVYCARVQPYPSGTDRCRGDDPELCLEPSCARAGDRSRNSSGFYCGADAGTAFLHRFDVPANFYHFS